MRELAAEARAQCPPAQVVLADGRRLAYAEYGAGGGRALILLHGTPGGRLQGAIVDDAARNAGVRVIAPDRPGTGWSDADPALSFVSFAEDLRQLVEYLGLDRVAVSAISGGGGFALAFAHFNPQHVSKVVLVSAMVPAPVSVRRKLALADRLMGGLVRRLPELARELMELTLSRITDEASLAQFAARLPAPDARVLSTPAARTLLLGDARLELRRHGLSAAVQELALYQRAAGFALRDIAVPVVLLHGEADTIVPAGLAQYTASQIPGARSEIIPGAAHLFLIDSPQRLIDLV